MLCPEPMLDGVTGEAEAARVSDLTREVESLAALDIHELRTRWRGRLRSVPPPNLPRSLLWRFLAYKLQAKALGELDRDTVRVLDRVARDHVRRREAANKPKVKVPPVPRDRQLKPGTLLVREHRGEMHRVTVVADGFRWRDTTYPSLSAVAEAITGTRWNGPRFFGLRDKADREARA